MTILGICDVPDILKVVRIVKVIITIIRIAIPILLIIMCMIDGVKATMSGELGELGKTLIRRAIAALLIFFVPLFVSLIVKTIAPNSEYTKCLNNASKDKIVDSYNNQMEELVKRAEESVTINDYYAAYIYLNNITDEKKREEYLERLNKVKEKIEAARKPRQSESGGYPAGSYGYCTFIEKKVTRADGGANIRYGVCVPENYNNTGIPMILWLHGSGEVGCSMSTLRNSGLPTVIEHWDKTGLAQIPAIIVAPILPSSLSYSSPSYTTAITAIINQVKNEYNINDNISLIGHSLGGSGVYHVAATHQSTFKSLVMLSGYVNSPSSQNMSYFKSIPIKGYSESGTKTKEFLKSIGKESEYRLLNTSHGGVPRAALTLDENNDGVSDLIYWMLSQGGQSYPVSGPVAGNYDCTKHDKYQTCAPKKGAYGSFAYYDSAPNSTDNRWTLEMDPNWRSKNLVTITTECSSGLPLKWTVHAGAKNMFKQAQEKMCQITTTGIDGIVYKPSQLTNSGSLAIRFISGSKSISLHSYGMAIDYNADAKITVNGKTFSPYQRDVKEYEAFVKELGNESDTRNVNYILWKKIFEPLGFKWGGNWGRNGNKSTFDGMHFEVPY